MTTNISSDKLTKKDFQVEDPVKWCAGCGGFSVLSTVQNALPETGAEKENIVFVSGIGCSSRFPYYINTYGFHSLHGRGSAIASGVKVANPKLAVWQVTGDGDSMAIGGNHTIHILRRNIDVNILLFNNRIYGLTKGQFSPTTPKGSKTKTSPEGTIENPFNAGELCIGAQGTFFARVLDNDPKLMKDVMIEGAAHKGTSMVEVLLNCVIFNNKVHDRYSNRETREDNTVTLQHGKPMVFGSQNDKGLRMNGLKLEVVTIGENGVTMDDIMVHDAKCEDATIHFMLARMSGPEYPVALGVIRSFETSTYEAMLEDQIETAQSNSKIKCMDDLLNSGQIFEVK